MIAKDKISRDNNPNKPVKINPIIGFIIFLENIFKVISPAIEVLGRGLISILIMGQFHTVFIINAVLILWSFKPIIEELEI